MLAVTQHHLLDGHKTGTQKRTQERTQEWDAEMDTAWDVKRGDKHLRERLNASPEHPNNNESISISYICLRLNMYGVQTRETRRALSIRIGCFSCFLVHVMLIFVGRKGR